MYKPHRSPQRVNSLERAQDDIDNIFLSRNLNDLVHDTPNLKRLMNTKSNLKLRKDTPEPLVDVAQFSQSEQSEEGVFKQIDREST